MPHSVLDAPITPQRQRLIHDMNMRRFSRETQRNYLRDIGRLATLSAESPGHPYDGLRTPGVCPLPGEQPVAGGIKERSVPHVAFVHQHLPAWQNLNVRQS